MKRRQFGEIRPKKGRPGFYIRFVWPRGGGGKPYERKGGATRAACDAKLRRIRDLLESGKEVQRVLQLVFGSPLGEGLSLVGLRERYLKYAEAVKKPKTVAGDRNRFRRLAKETWARIPLDSVRPAQIRTWAERRLRSGRTPATVNRDLSLISALAKWAIDNDLVQVNPVERVRRFSEKGRDREVFLKPAEARRYVGGSRPDYRALALTALATGMRLDELLTLEKRHLDFDRNVIRVRAEMDKVKDGREIPMGASVRATLLEQVDSIDATSRVFRRADGLPHTPQTVKRRHKEAKCRAGLPGYKLERLRFHDLRHTAASLMVARRVPIYEVAHILGHKDIGMTMRYAHFQPELGRAAIKELDNALGLDACDGEPEQDGEPSHA